MNAHFKKINDRHLISPQPKRSDTRPAEVQSFLPLDRPDLIEELQCRLREHIVSDPHRLKENYIRLDFNQFPIVSLWKRDSIIVGFATCWARDFYPMGSIRLLNRIYQFPDNCRIFFTREIFRPTVKNCFLQQYHLVEELGFETAFISRELRAQHFFRRFVDQLQTVSPTPWVYKSGPYRVAPSEDFSCYQSIGATSLRGKNLDHFFSYWKTK